MKYLIILLLLSATCQAQEKNPFDGGIVFNDSTMKAASGFGLRLYLGVDTIVSLPDTIPVKMLITTGKSFERAFHLNGYRIITGVGPYNGMLPLSPIYTFLDGRKRPLPNKYYVWIAVEDSQKSQTLFSYD